ncbi:MAG: dihydrolipoyl dehydrogenase [Burkholderiaceae bacterium]
MKTRKTDIVVIGAGTAGLAAYRALRDAGQRAVVIDHGPLGTLCARAGCMPSKAALHAARRFADASALARWDRAAREVQRDRLWREVRRLRDHLADGTADSTRDALGRSLVMGSARFIALDAVEVDGMRIEARAFVVATGSHPVLPDALARYGTSIARGVLTTDTLFSLKRLPATLGLLGLGNIGIEIGLAMARFGVKVVAVEKNPWPAGILDPVIAKRAIKTLGREMEMHFGATGHVTRDGSQFRLAIGDTMHRVERVLAALGRRPNLAGLALDRAGVTWDESDAPPIDPHTLRLGRTHIFVAGDASPDRPLQHEAIDEGRIAAANALSVAGDHAPQRPSRRTPLSIVFSDPDIAQVGMRHDEVHRDRVVVGTGSGDHNGRSKILGDEANLVRVYADRRDGTLFGGSLVSTQGEHLAHLLAWAVDQRLTVDRLLAMPFYHPTVEELLQTALKDVSRKVVRR